MKNCNTTSIKNPQKISALSPIKIDKDGNPTVGEILPFVSSQVI